MLVNGEILREATAVLPLHLKRCKHINKHALTAPNEALLRCLLRKFFAHINPNFVTTTPNRSAHKADDVAHRAAKICVHFLQCGGQDSKLYALAPRVHNAENIAHGVIEKNRITIGNHHKKRDIVSVAKQAIALRWGVSRNLRARIKHDDVVAMNLLHRHERAVDKPQRLQQNLPILRDIVRAIADMKGEVERVVWRLALPAMPIAQCPNEVFLQDCEHGFHLANE